MATNFRDKIGEICLFTFSRPTKERRIPRASANSHSAKYSAIAEFTTEFWDRTRTVWQAQVAWAGNTVHTRWRCVSFNLSSLGCFRCFVTARRYDIAHYMPLHCVCVSVCLSQVGVLSKTLRESSWYSAQTVSLTHPEHIGNAFYLWGKICGFKTFLFSERRF